MLAAADMPCSNQRILPACGPTAANSLHASAVGEWDSLTETERRREGQKDGHRAANYASSVNESRVALKQTAVI